MNLEAIAARILNATSIYNTEDNEATRKAAILIVAGALKDFAVEWKEEEEKNERIKKAASFD